MRGGAFLVPLVLLTPAVAQEEDRVGELERRIAELERENEFLRRRIAWLEMLRPRADGTKKQTAVIRLGGEPERDHLQGIVLPEDADKAQVEEYVARILRAARAHRRTFGTTDPEVELLRRVGPSHVDVLIEPLVYVPALDGDSYLVEALKAVAGEEHKGTILEALPSAWELVEVVIEREWIEEATPILLQVLADRDSWRLRTLPVEWIEAVACLARPESYEHLRAYFHYGDNRYHTWRAIRHLPGLDLKSNVDVLWPWARDRERGWTRTTVAAVAAHYGHMDALALLFEEPDQFPQWDVIESVTPYRGPRSQVERAKEWFRTNRDRLVFDPEKDRYRLADEGTAAGER